MSYDLQLRKGGILVTNEWDSDIADYVEQKIDRDELLFYLHDIVCLDSNVNIRDVFLLVSKNIKVFSHAVGCPFLEDLVIEALSYKVDNEANQDIDHLELGRAASMHKGKMFMHMDFSGKGSEETWAIEFSPINELISYPIILNENVVVESDESDEIMFEFQMSFTLLDLIRGIVEELSFVGPPDVKAFALNELKERHDDVVNGNIKEYDDEKIQANLEKQRDEFSRPCKICGEDARSPHFRKPSNMCYKCFRRTKEN